MLTKPEVLRVISAMSGVTQLMAKLLYVLNLSRRAMSVVKQNLIFALAVIVMLISSAFFNLVSLPLGLGARGQHRDRGAQRAEVAGLPPKKNSDITEWAMRRTAPSSGD